MGMKEGARDPVPRKAPIHGNPAPMPAWERPRRQERRSSLPDFVLCIQSPTNEAGLTAHISQGLRIIFQTC